MAITQDASTPAFSSTIGGTNLSSTGTGINSQASASFSPPAGSLVAVVVQVSYGTLESFTSTGLSVADSLSNSFTAAVLNPAKPGSVNSWISSVIFTRYYAGAPGSITVTASLASGQRDGTYGQAINIVPLVLAGCGSSQSGAATATLALGQAQQAAQEVTVTTTVTGSWVLLVTGNIGAVTPTALANTSTLSGVASDGSGLAFYYGRQSSATGTPGATTLGWSDSEYDAHVTALEILPLTASAVTLSEAAGAADQVAVQVTAIPPAIITAPPRPAGPPPPAIPAQILTVPQGNAAPQDAAGAAETMTAGTVTVPLTDQAAAADSIAGGIYPADQAAAADALAITTVATTYTDPAAAADANLPQVQVALTENAAAADTSQTTGLTQADTAAAADQLTAAVTLAVTERAAAADGFGNEPAIGASGGATRPTAMPGTSQVSVAAPGSSRWYYLGSVGQVTALTYSYACPGGADAMSATLMVPASYRNQILYPGWQVRITRGGHQIWDGKLDEPVPTTSGWNLTAVGNGMRGSDFLAVYSDTWPSSQPDESINGAISRGLPWVNPGVGTPSGAWYGQGVDSGAQTITALLNLICTRGGLTWYVNSQPGGRPGDDLSVFPLPTTPNRLLVATTPVPRTLGGDINTIYLRYEITADNPSSTTSSSAPATYGLAVAQNTASVAQHGEMETYIDISDVGVMTQAAAQAVGNSVLQIYQRASFAGPFTGHYGDLLTMGGTPIDPGTDQAGTVCRLILTDFGWGGELVPGPVQFIVGGYTWDDMAQTFSATPYQNLDQSLTGLLQMENTVMTPITVASTG